MCNSSYRCNKKPHACLSYPLQLRIGQPEEFLSAAGKLHWHVAITYDKIFLCCGVRVSPLEWSLSQLFILHVPYSKGGKTLQDWDVLEHLKQPVC